MMEMQAKAAVAGYKNVAARFFSWLREYAVAQMLNKELIRFQQFHDSGYLK